MQTVLKGSVRGAALALVGFFIAYNIFLVTGHHRIRVSLIDVREIDGVTALYQPPARLDPRFRFENRDLLTALHSPLPQPTRPPESDLAMVIQTLGAFGDTFGRAGVHYCPEAESPTVIIHELVAKGCRGACSADAIAFGTLIQKSGLVARHVVLASNDGLGGTGHSVVEVWLPDIGKWIMVDPQNVAYVMDEAGKHLSVAELRDTLLRTDGSGLQIVQHPLGFSIPAVGGRLQDFYRDRIRDVNYVAGNRLFTLNETSGLRRALSIAERLLSPLGPQALYVPRFFGRLLHTGVRFRPLDDLNSSSYWPEAWFITYRVLLGLFLAALTTLGVGWLLRRRG